MDDGSINQVKVAVPILDKYHFKATFFVIAGPTLEKPDQSSPPAGAKRLPDGWCGVSWQQWRVLAAKGYEIGCHTLSHLHMDQIKDAATLQREIVDSAGVIEDKVGTRPISFAFPFSASNDMAMSLAQKTYVAVRGPSMVYLSSGYLERYDAYIDDLIKNRKAGVGMLHGLDGVGWESVKSDTFRAHVEYLAKHQDELWVDTLGNVSLYCKERDNAKVATVASTPDSVILDVACDLNSHAPLMPLTVVVSTNTNAPKDVRAWRGVHQLKCTTQGTNVMVDVVPGNEPVTVTWEPTSTPSASAHPQPAIGGLEAAVRQLRGTGLTGTT
jgi:peptidoglycan/xylan/chitin deacetylase (PgdA/CDA1 family)